MLLAALAGTACDDGLDLIDESWTAAVDTVTLYTVDVPAYQGLPAAFDIRVRRTQRVEDPSATGSWDFALAGGGAEPLALVPLGAFFDVSSSAGIATISGESFDQLDRAPGDTAAYVRTAPVILSDGAIYVVRSRQFSCGGAAASNFAKMEALDVDQDAGTFRFRVTANPRCNDRALVPPED